MKTFFDARQTPDQNRIVLAFFKGLLGPQIGKYQDRMLVLTDGRSRLQWSDVIQWRYSEVENAPPLITKDRAAKDSQSSS